MRPDVLASPWNDVVFAIVMERSGDISVMVGGDGANDPRLLASVHGVPSRLTDTTTS